jgi:hypothetical protein
MSSDSVNSYMPPCSSSPPGHDINMMWTWKVGCRYIREHPEECVPVCVEDVGDGGFGEVLFDGTATSTLQVIRPAWGGGAPCPRGHGNPEVRARDYGHGRAVPRG